MGQEKKIYAARGIQANTCFSNEPVWVQEDNVSTYYNHVVETQCRVATRSVEEIMKEVLAAQQAQA